MFNPSLFENPEALAKLASLNPLAEGAVAANVDAGGLDDNGGFGAAAEPDGPGLAVGARGRHEPEPGLRDDHAVGQHRLTASSNICCTLERVEAASGRIKSLNWTGIARTSILRKG